jgi:hypothetical protein
VALLASVMVLTFTTAALELLSGPRLLPLPLRPAVSALESAGGLWRPVPFALLLVLMVGVNELYFLNTAIRTPDLTAVERYIVLAHVVTATGWVLYLLQRPRQT